MTKRLHTAIQAVGVAILAVPQGSCEKISKLDGPGATPVQAAANLIDATSFVSVPLLHRNKTLGRVYVTARKARFFNKSDETFLVQVS